MRIIRSTFDKHSMINKRCIQSGTFAILLSLVCSLAVPVSAAELADALEASRRGDDQAALSILKQLASSGDKLAKFNLALFYKNGTAVAASEQLADYWFAQAAEDGVVDAYQQLATAAIRPGKAAHVDLVFGPQEWIRAQNPQRYTLQLASSKSPKLIKHNYTEHALQGRGGYFLNKQNGRYVLVFGSFASSAEASAAINDLPGELRKWSPWVRRMSQIQKSMSDPG